MTPPPAAVGGGDATDPEGQPASGGEAPGSGAPALPAGPAALPPGSATPGTVAGSSATRGEPQADLLPTPESMAGFAVTAGAAILSWGVYTVVATLAALLLGGWAASWIWRSRGSHGPGRVSSLVRGRSRRRVLETYWRLEELLARESGMPRHLTETPGGHLARASRRLPNLGADLDFLGGAVGEAAYGPARTTPERAEAAQQAFRRIADALLGPRDAESGTR